ncbi:MAG TPA: ribonuclease domain-containing protein [Rhodanobacter sp.]|nr:ribonuclease domain-containing protein [Rhodanobacter sp.]
MRRLQPLILLAALVVALVMWRQPPSTSPGAAPSAPEVASQIDHAGDSSTLPAFLPPEARDTLRRIASGGPFAHSQDGTVFGNYERHLPQQPRGYYHEYTVETPGARNRGVRRIITGDTPPRVYYYTDDHYRSFRRFTVQP